MTLTHVSVTELTKFRDCRRQWYLSKIERLEEKTPPLALWFGKAIHAGLEAYYGWELAESTGSSPLDDQPTHMLSAYQEYIAASFEEMADEYGGYWEQVIPEYEAMIPLGAGMLVNYVDFDREQGPIFTTKEVEVAAVIPTETGVAIVAHLDVLGDGERGEVVMDHKSYKSKPNFGTVLDLDPQLTGYAWVRWKITGEVPAWYVYNVLMKRLPKPPELLKSGFFSRDVKQFTTEALYRRTVEAAGRSFAPYARVLAALRERGWSDFFLRAATQRSMEQVLSWQRHAFNTIEDMKLVAEEPSLAYPSPSQIRCPGCPYLELCLAMEERGDVEAIVEAKYFQRPEEA